MDKPSTRGVDMTRAQAARMIRPSARQFAAMMAEEKRQDIPVPTRIEPHHGNQSGNG